MVGKIKWYYFYLLSIIPAVWTLFPPIIRAEAFCSPGSYEKLVKQVTNSTGTTYQFKCSPIFGGNVAQAGQNAAAQVSEITVYVGNFATSLAGISMGVATLVIVYAAFLYVTSGGDPKKVQTAKNLIFGAGIGMMICFLGFVILGIMKSVIGF